MKTHEYEVAFPIIKGWQVFTIEAKSRKDAREKAMDGEYYDTYFDKVDLDYSTCDITQESSSLTTRPPILISHYKGLVRGHRYKH